MKEDNIQEEGRIISYFSGIAKIEGFAHIFIHEVLVDEEGGQIALVIGFDEFFTEALFFDENFDPNKRVFRSYERFSLQINDAIIGRVINGLGGTLDALGPLRGEKKDVFAKAPEIIERDLIDTFLCTGIKVIDATLSLGRGQRELIIGDKKLGKSTLATDIVLNQKNIESPLYCVYVLCGQKERKLQELIEIFEHNNTFLYSTIVSASADASFAELYLAPFVGCTIAEYFRDQGKDALIVYDDLSHHAKAYRDISLLLERSPGREAYPGDIFSLHATLLERSAKLSKEQGGGSLTAFPIVETQEGDVTSFVSTNIISITDGQIYLENGLFQKRFLPAVNVGLSVSRVGHIQPQPLKDVTKSLRLMLSQHKELQKLAKLETTKSKEATQKIHRGELLLEILKQDKHRKISWQEQVILFSAVEGGHFDDLAGEEWKKFEVLLLEMMRNKEYRLIEKITDQGVPEGMDEKIRIMIESFKKEFLL